MDRLHAMEIFVRAVEAGSFTAAAKALGMGQPAVSKRVADLEAHLGTALILRSTREFAVTEAGQNYYEHARAALAEAEEAEAAARGAGRGLVGRLRVSAPVTLTRLKIVPALDAFLSEHPDLTLELVMDDRQVDLVREGVDLAIRAGSLSDSALVARRIAHARRSLVAAPAYLDRYGVPVRPEELPRHHAILPGGPAREAIWRLGEGAAAISVTVPGRLAVNAAEGLREALIAGLGIGMASHWLVGRELADGRLVVLLPDWSVDPVDLWAVFPAGRVQSRKVRAFVEFVSAVMARD